jgi:hypothetical protein
MVDPAMLVVALRGISQLFDAVGRLRRHEDTPEYLDARDAVRKALVEQVHAMENNGFVQLVEPKTAPPSPEAATTEAVIRDDQESNPTELLWPPSESGDVDDPDDPDDPNCENDL